MWSDSTNIKTGAFVPKAGMAFCECPLRDTGGLLTWPLTSMDQSCGIAYPTKLDPLMTTETLKGT